MKPAIKKIFIWTWAVVLLATASPTAAQPVKVHRVGVLSEGTDGSKPFGDIKSFRQGLRGLGYEERKNIIIEYRNAEGNRQRLPDLVAELIHLKVDVIVATSGVPARVAKQATHMIPIVMTVSGDPIMEGLTTSLARPDGNVTGMTIQAVDLSGKRLELLKETFPKISHVAVLWRPLSAVKSADLTATEVVARTLRLEVKPLSVEIPRQLDSAFDVASVWGANALLPLAHRFVAIHRRRIIELATKKSLPAIYPNRTFVEAGGLMSYGPNHSDLTRRAAYFVDKILKGAKPSDLPVEQPTKFELVVNLKTAKHMGLTIPPEILMWANEVIK
jgi:putative ABC transport system substrate-binding protein